MPKKSVLLSVSATPISGTVEEQFISLPDSPKVSEAKATEGAEQAKKALAEQATATSPAGRELPWNQASAHIRSPLLRLHTGEQNFEQLPPVHPGVPAPRDGPVLA